MHNVQRFLFATIFSFGVFATIAGCSQTPAPSAEKMRPAAPADLQWTLTKPMRTTRYGHLAISLPDGKVLVTGGFGGKGSGDVLSSAEIYDSISQRWSNTGVMTIPRFATKAVLLLDGRVMVAGGQSIETLTDGGGSFTTLSYDGVASAEVYNPAHKAWSAVEPMSVGRLGHTLTVLKDGRVLAVGGRSATDDALDYKIFDSAELFDPATDKWMMTKSMTTRRICHTATLLPNGKVLIAGGRT